MTDAAISFAGSGPVRRGQELDGVAVARWLSAHVEGYRGPLTIEQFNGGQSNPTYRLRTPGRDYVLRRKPAGTLLKGAHAVEREYRVTSALAAAGFPVARPYGLCEDGGVIGTPFFVMEMVEGRIFWSPSLPDLGAADRAAYFDAMNATLARLHSFDPAALGLADFGRSENYLARQIARWSQQYRDDDLAGVLPELDWLAEWLPAHIPPGDESRLVHGDYRADNLVFAAQGPDVLAVLDWELSTLGHPLADFTYHLMMYRLPSHILGGLVGSDLAALGIPSEADYVAAYCRRTGRERIDQLDFYLAYNMFRFAAIIHGIKGRMVRGTAASPHAASLVAILPELAAIALAQAERQG
jgi:aminoglycoside phosphotransferase (APT) family kinase protein